MKHKHTEAEAEVKDVDESLDIIKLFDGENFNFDCVVAEMEGDSHPVIVNHESDRAYYILKGSGQVQVGEEEIPVEGGELVTIPKETKHSISGDLRYLVITSPPFNPENEEVVEE